MRNFLISILFFLSLLGNAQVWCPPGAEWSYSFIEGAWGCDGIYRYKYIGDTIINSTSCKIIQQTKTIKCPWETQFTTSVFANHFMYADSDKVYYLKNNQFNVLYDFSVQVGDTLNILSQSVYPNCDSIAVLKVDTIGTMMLNSQSLRYYSVQAITNSPYVMNSRVVERVGPFYNYSSDGMNYFFPAKSDTCGVFIDETPEYGVFKCYRDDNFSTVSLSPDTCSFTLEIDEGFKTKLHIYPNPVISHLNVSFIHTGSNQIQIFDIPGNLIYSTNCSGQFLQIDCSEWNNGMYFIETIAEDSSKRQEKFLKVK